MTLDTMKPLIDDLISYSNESQSKVREQGAKLQSLIKEFIDLPVWSDVLKHRKVKFKLERNKNSYGIALEDYQISCWQNGIRLPKPISVLQYLEMIRKALRMANLSEDIDKWIKGNES